MLTDREYQQLKKQLEEDRRQAEEEYKRDLEALDRVYRIKNRITATKPKEPLSTESNGSRHDRIAERTEMRRGALTQKVRNVVMAMPSDFTIISIASALAAKGIVAKMGSIRPILARLQEGDEIELVSQGIGRRPSVYRRKEEGNA